MVAVWTTADAAAPAVLDTEYADRLAEVRWAAAHPDGRPLAVVVGSSRMTWAFQPTLLHDDPLVWASASHFGAGPVFDRVLLHRLLRDGVRPSVVIVEVMPTFFLREEAKLVARHLTTEELLLARRYWGGADLEYRFVEHRAVSVRRLGRAFDSPSRDFAQPPREGHLSLLESVTPEERARRTAAMQRQHGAAAAELRIPPGAGLALRDTLREAADHGIRVVLLRSPEGQTFRSWYNPNRLAEFDRFVRDTAAEFGVPIIDAREWLDDDDFSDSHHTLRGGAAKFTPRLSREVRQILAPR